MSTLTEIRDAMVTALRSANPNVAPVNIRKELDVVLLSEEDLLRYLPEKRGKQIRVMALGKIGTERADRNHDRHGLTLAVLAAERIDPDYEHLLNPDEWEALSDWADERIDWVEDSIYLPLGSTTFAPVTGAIIEPGGARIDEVIDRRYLTTHGIFWSELSFTYTLDEANH